MPRAKSIYIFGAEPQAGKSVVLLGIMELLSRHMHFLGGLWERTTSKTTM